MIAGAYLWLRGAVVGVAAAVALATVGVANAEDVPLSKRLPRLKSYNIAAYEPTPQNEERLRKFIDDVLQFTLLHETGHMVFWAYSVPLGSLNAEETAADGFAAAVLTSDISASERHNPLRSAALFWDAAHQMQRVATAGEYNWADEHAPPEQRAYNAACLLYGANPKAFADLAEAFGLQTRRDFCIHDSEKNRKDWAGNVLQQHINPNSGKPLDSWTPYVAVVHESVGKGVPNDWIATLSRERELVRSLGTLDDVAKNLLVLKKTDRDRALEDIQKRLKKPSSNVPPDLNHVDMNPIIRPYIDHPAETASLKEYNYSVVGSSCLKNGVPDINAFWTAEERRITLCYMFVSYVERIGKLLIAAEDCSRSGHCEKLGSPEAIVDPRLVGTWELPVNGGRWVMSIQENAAYALHSEANDGVPASIGTFSTDADNKRWTLEATNIDWKDSGTYSVLSSSEWTAYSVKFRGSGTWRRVANGRN